jgi:hypothetical protein
LQVFQKPTLLETDASSVGVDAVMHQDGHPLHIFQKPWGLEIKRSLPILEKCLLYMRPEQNPDTIC